MARGENRRKILKAIGKGGWRQVHRTHMGRGNNKGSRFNKQLY